MSDSHTSPPVSGVAEQILDSIKIPSLPEAAVKILTMCREELAGAGEIVRIIELEPALSARVLKIANSAAFGLQRRINTLTRAAVVLGNENLRVVALGFYLTSGFAGMGGRGFDLREFWRDSVIRACLARRLAQAVRYQPREEAFLAGMLQDIGTLILATHFGFEYAETVAGCREDNVRRRLIETEQFGIDHAYMAQALAQRWNLPETLVVALGKQCTEPACIRTNDPVELLWQIAYFCAAVPFGPERQTARVGAHLRNIAYTALDLSFEGLSNVFSDAVEQFNTLRSIFVRLIPRDCEVASIMDQARALIEASSMQINEEPAEH